MPRPRKVNPDTVELAKREYSRMVDNGERDENGFYKLTYTPQMIDDKADQLTSSIESLEDKLRKFKDQKKQFETLKTTETYKESKKQKKKGKKARQNLLESVFNNADKIILDSGEDSSDDHYDDSPKEKRRAAREKKKDTTLDTTYGKRYSPLVTMLYDMAQDYDDIAEDIQQELKTKQGMTRGMYRSSQMGNLLTAKNSKFSVVKEIITVANKVTDMEYKKEKDTKGEETDTTRAITYLGAQFLRGTERDSGKTKASFVLESGKKKKKGKKDKSKKTETYHTDSDDDDDEGEVSSYTVNGDDSDTANRKNADKFVKLLLGRRDDIKLDPHEYHINMEGKYKFVVVADDIEHPEKSWEFVAVDPNTDKKIKGFKEKYKELYPKKKLCRMRFDLERGCAIDKESNKKYQLLFRNDD